MTYPAQPQSHCSLTTVYGRSSRAADLPLKLNPVSRFKPSCSLFSTLFFFLHQYGSRFIITIEHATTNPRTLFLCSTRISSADSIRRLFWPRASPLCRLRLAVCLSHACALTPLVHLIFPSFHASPSSYLLYLSLVFVLCLLIP